MMNHILPHDLRTTILKEAMKNTSEPKLSILKIVSTDFRDIGNQTMQTADWKAKDKLDKFTRYKFKVMIYQNHVDEAITEAIASMNIAWVQESLFHTIIEDEFLQKSLFKHVSFLELVFGTMELHMNSRILQLSSCKLIECFHNEFGSVRVSFMNGMVCFNFGQEISQSVTHMLQRELDNLCNAMHHFPMSIEIYTIVIRLLSGMFCSQLLSLMRKNHSNGGIYHLVQLLCAFVQKFPNHAMLHNATLNIFTNILQDSFLQQYIFPNIDAQLFKPLGENESFFSRCEHLDSLHLLALSNQKYEIILEYIIKTFSSSMNQEMKLFFCLLTHFCSLHTTDISEESRNFIRVAMLTSICVESDMKNVMMNIIKHNLDCFVLTKINPSIVTDSITLLSLIFYHQQTSHLMKQLLLKDLKKIWTQYTKSKIQFSDKNQTIQKLISDKFPLD